MRTYLLDSPAAAATRAANPCPLPGVSGAPRLAARVRLARGTIPPVVPSEPTADTMEALAEVRALVQLHGCTDDTIDACLMVRSLVASHGSVRDDAGTVLLPPLMVRSC